MDECPKVFIKNQVELSFNQKKLISRSLDETNLSIRAKNCLKNLNCKYLGDAIIFGRSEIIHNRNMGVKSFKEITDLIQSEDLKLGDQITPWNSVTINKLREYFKNYLNKITSKKNKDGDKCLENEIKRIFSLLSFKKFRKNATEYRNIEIFFSFYGLDGTAPKTLQIVANKYGVTRERIRQIVAKINKKIEYLECDTPILNIILDEISQLVPIETKRCFKLLNKKKLIKDDFSMQSLILLQKIIHQTKDFSIIKYNKTNFVINNEDKSYASLREIHKHINKKISQQGTESIENLNQFFFQEEFNKELLVDFISSFHDHIWLDKEQLFFTFSSNPRNRMFNLIIKAAIIHKKILAESLLKLISKNYRLDVPINFNKNHLKNFCKKIINATIDNETIDFSKVDINSIKRYESPHSNNEKKFIDIFKKFGPIIQYDDLKEFALYDEISLSSLTAILQWSPIAIRIDTGFYSLQNIKMSDSSEKIISIIDTSSLSFSKEECPPMRNKATYIEIHKGGTIIKALPYTRPLRILPDKSYGVTYKKRVYPIVKTLVEKNGERIEKNI